MHTVLENIVKNVRSNRHKFQEIKEDELIKREINLKEKYEIMIRCKEEIRRIYINAKEREIKIQREMNKNYLLNNKNVFNTNIEKNTNNEIYTKNIKDENLDLISENTEKLYNAALIISQELNEQNNLIEEMNKNIDNESKLKEEKKKK